MTSWNSRAIHQPLYKTYDYVIGFTSQDARKKVSFAPCPAMSALSLVTSAIVLFVVVQAIFCCLSIGVPATPSTLIPTCRRPLSSTFAALLVCPPVDVVHAIKTKCRTKSRCLPVYVIFCRLRRFSHSTSLTHGRTPLSSNQSTKD